MGTTLRKHLVSILNIGLVLFGLQCAAHAQGIVATHSSDGRLVYENAPETTPKPAKIDTGLFYWSNTAHNWKQVPPMYSHSMRAARSAADDVRRELRRATLNDERFYASGNGLRLASEPAQDVQTFESNTPQIAGRSRSSRRQFAMTPSAPPWIDTIVQQAATRHSVDPNLVRAIVQVESNFNPQAVSRKGAIGLMQLMPRTAKSLNVSNPYDPAQNVDAGVRHFKELLDSYGGDLQLSLAAYNAGQTAVHRSGGVPNYSETRNYVKRITGIYGSNTARLYTGGRPLAFKKDSEGHLSVSNIE
jgi:hypothetical protein